MTYIPSPLLTTCPVNVCQYVCSAVLPNTFTVTSFSKQLHMSITPSVLITYYIAKHIHCYFLPQTTSHVCNSLSTNYLLYLTCNDLPFRQV